MKAQFIDGQGFAHEQLREVINLTPHPVIFRWENGVVKQEIPPSGQTARIAEETIPGGMLDIGPSVAAIEIEGKRFGQVQGLPTTPDPGTVYIVPLLTALAAKAAGRDVSDLLVPGTQTRDGDGTVNGCLTLASLA